MRLLLVEDDEKIAGFITKGLRQEGFVVDWTPNGVDGLILAQTHPYDVAIVDVMLPERDGLSLIADMRRSKLDIPVIVLSAKSSVDDRVRGLQAGGDDYLTKPFAFAELLARVQALVRRASQGHGGPAALTFHDLSLDLLARRVTRAGREIDLQAKEFALLEYLMRNQGRVLSKTMILQQIWGYDFDPQTNVVDVLVCRLRNKIDRDFPVKYIQTLRGVGYVLRQD